MTYTHTGNCPRCGAPIFGIFDALPHADSEGRASTNGKAPVAHFTCECRTTLPVPVPDVDPDHVESVDDADRKHLARNRPVQREEPSEERSE